MASLDSLLAVLTALAFKPAFVTYGIMSPTILLFLALIGQLASEERTVPVISGHEVYLKDDGALP